MLDGPLLWPCGNDLSDGPVTGAGTPSPICRGAYGNWAGNPINGKRVTGFSTP